MYLGRRLACGAHESALRASRWSNLEARMLGPLRRWRRRLTGYADGLRALAPYAALALTLPGGTLVALALLGMRHRAALPPLRGVVLAAIVAASIVLRGST